MRITALSLLLLLFLSACSKSKEAERRREILRVPQPAARQAAKKKRADGLYDDNGLLLPSGQTVAGLALPRGLKLRSKLTDLWLFETTVPVNKLHWYFGARLSGGSVKTAGETTTYMAALPRENSGSVVRLNVRIGPSPARKGVSLVNIRQLPVRVPPKQPPLEAVRQQAAEQRRRAD